MRPDHTANDSDSLFRFFEPSDVSTIYPLYIASAGYVSGHSDDCTGSKNEDGAIFLYTIAGNGLVQQKSKSVSLPPNSCCLIDCRNGYRYEASPSEETWSYYYLCLNGRGLLSYAPHLFQTLRCLYPLQPERILEICRIFLHELPGKMTLSASRACLLLQELLNSLLESRLCAQVPVKSNVLGEQNPLSPAFAHIREHYAELITVDELARICHLSKYYFVHLFKEFCGESPYQYLSRYRIDVAKHLLADKNIPLHHVAAMVGYPTYTNFLTQFKKYVNAPRTVPREPYQLGAKASVCK